MINSIFTVKNNQIEKTNSLSNQSNQVVFNNFFLNQINSTLTQIDWYERVALSKTDVANRTFLQTKYIILNNIALYRNDFISYER